MARVMQFMRPAAPFIVAIWTVGAWLVMRQSATGFLALFITVPVGFLQLATLGFLFWLRPSARLSGSYRTEDLLWYFGTFALWLIGAVMPSATAAGLVQILAFLVGAVAIYRIGRSAQEENVNAMRHRFERGASEQFGDPAADSPSGWGRARIITINTTPTRRGDSVGHQMEVVDGEIIDEPDPRIRRGDDPDEWTARPHRDS